MKESNVKVFYSYSHEDEDIRDELEMHLSVLRRAGVIEEWHDRKISPGSNWQEDIDENLANSDIVILLVSSNFLASDYCYDVETATALDLHKNNELVVIPIIVRPCYWEVSRFAKDFKLQALPKDAKPISTQKDKDEAWVQVARGIHEVALEIINRRESKLPTIEERDNDKNFDEGQLIKDFLQEFSRWYFSPLRIVKWGGRKKGFEKLRKLKSSEVSKILKKFEEDHIVKSILSQKGNPIYKLK